MTTSEKAAEVALPGQEPEPSVHHGEDVALDPRMFREEVSWAKFIPGYSPKRSLKLRGRPMITMIFLLSGISIMFFGWDSGAMSQINQNPDYLRIMGIDQGTNRDAAAVGGLVSLWFAGFGIGAILTGFVADRVGRLRTIFIGCLWAVLGGALQGSAQNITWFAISRVIGGIGCGHLNTVVPIWTSEIADAKHRGAFVAVGFGLALLGGNLVYWSEFAAVKTRTMEFSWRFPLSLQLVFLVIIMAAVPFFPESAHHLAKTNRMAEARDVISRCRINWTDAQVDQEMREIFGALQLEASEASPSYWDIMTKKDKLYTRRRILLGAGIQVMQKLTGTDFISTYAPQMFGLAGYTGDKPALLGGGNYIGFMGSLVVAIYLCDRLGRRKNMLIGSGLMFIILLVAGILCRETIVQHEHDPAKAARFGAGVTATLYIYTFVYGSTWITTCWVYPTEIFPLASRAKGTALSTVAFSVASGVTIEIIPYLISAISYWVLIMFALINLVMLVPIYLFYIETAGRNLQDFDLLFACESPLFWKAERAFREYKELEAAADPRASGKVEEVQ